MAAVLTMGTAAMAQGQAFPSSVSVTGTAEREIVPDEIYLSITIDESTTKGKVPVAEQERKMIASLRGLGIDVEKDLRVGDIAGDLQTYLLRKDRVLTSKTYSLKVGDADMLSNVFGVLADQGISNAAVTSATRSDIDKIRMELRTEAMHNARSSAEALAAAIGQKIGKAFQIGEYNYGGPVYYAADNAYATRAMGISMKEEAVETSLDFKDLKITHTVNVQFVLE